MKVPPGRYIPTLPTNCLLFDGSIPQKEGNVNTKFLPSADDARKADSNSNANANGAVYNGKEFWLGVADLDGNIVQIWTYDEAESRGFFLRRRLLQKTDVLFTFGTLCGIICSLGSLQRSRQQIKCYTR